MKCILTEHGQKKIDGFINECISERKRILDNQIDTKNIVKTINKEKILRELNFYLSHCYFFKQIKSNLNFSTPITDNYAVEIDLIHDVDFLPEKGENYGI